MTKTDIKEKSCFENFEKLDIRVGEIVKAEPFTNAKKPAFKVWVDYGEPTGILKSSAQITELYSIDDLKGMQVLGVVNFPSRQIADFMSEALILGIYTDEGVVLITPQQKVSKGDRLG